MEHQSEGLGLRPPDTAEETTSETAENSARTTGDPEPRPATGEPRVDAALARLDELEGLPVTEHRAVFEDVHRRLRDVLGELDTGQPLQAGHAAGPTSRPGRLAGLAIHGKEDAAGHRARPQRTGPVTGAGG